MLGNVMFALFALLGPVTALGSWAEARSRNRRQQRDEDSSRGLVIATLRADAIGARDAERRRRRAESPDLAAIVTDCGNRASRLWERRLDHIDIGRLPIGVADLGWTADLDARGIEVSPEVAAAVAGTLTDTPLVIPFEEVGVIGIVGRSRSGRALARGIVTEVLAWYGPADLDLAIADGSVGSDGGPWDWVSWAPHDGSSPVRGADVAEWSARLPRPVSGRRRLVVIDGDDLLVGRASLSLRNQGSGVSLLLRRPCRCQLRVASSFTCSTMRGGQALIGSINPVGSIRSWSLDCRLIGRWALPDVWRVLRTVMWTRAAAFRMIFRSSGCWVETSTPQQS
jgi:hypothetical protein